MVMRLSSKSQFKIVTRNTEWTGLPQSGEVIDLALPHGVQVSTTGLILSDELDDEEWQAVGLKLATIKTSTQWAIGDWWAYGDATYGKRAEAAAKKLPYELGTLMNLGSVARKVPTSLRNEALSWSHHKEVAPLSADDQKKWLAKAAKLNWSVKKLRERMHDQKQTDTGRDPALWGTSQIRRYIEQAERARWQISFSDSPEFDRVSDGDIHDLVASVSVTLAAWREFSKNVKAYQQRRTDAGDDFKPRPLEDDNVAILQAAE